jgi:hypothetical protein
VLLAQADVRLLAHRPRGDADRLHRRRARGAHEGPDGPAASGRGCSVRDGVRRSLTTSTRQDLAPAGSASRRPVPGAMRGRRGTGALERDARRASHASGSEARGSRALRGRTRRNAACGPRRTIARRGAKGERDQSKRRRPQQAKAAGM